MCMFETELSQAHLCLCQMLAYCSAGGGPPDSRPFSHKVSLQDSALFLPSLAECVFSLLSFSRFFWISLTACPAGCHFQKYPQFRVEIRQEHLQTGANSISVSETGAFPQCVAEIPRQARDDRKRSRIVILSLPKSLSRACRRNLRSRDSARNRGKSSCHFTLTIGPCIEAQ